ncbi:MAG: DUF1800 family protein, partial [Dermatophilaceae bacterium]
ARALAVRFVSDDPPAELVDELAAVYTEQGTAIRPVLERLFASTTFWESIGAKTRRPLESVAHAFRAIGLTTDKAGIDSLYWADAGLTNLGQAPLMWPSPNGYPDVAAAWSSAGAMLGRWNMNLALVSGWWDGLSDPDPTTLVGPNPPATAGAYVDQMATRLTGVGVDEATRTALLTFLGLAADAAVEPDLQGKAAQLAALVLDSPRAQLR